MVLRSVGQHVTRVSASEANGLVNCEIIHCISVFPINATVMWRYTRLKGAQFKISAKKKALKPYFVHAYLELDMQNSTLLMQDTPAMSPEGDTLFQT